jgi:hypothetical protein
MTAKQFRALLAKLEMSQRAAARLFRVNERTSRRWVLGELNVPPDVANNLTELAAGKTTLQQIEQRYASL